MPQIAPGSFEKKLYSMDLCHLPKEESARDQLYCMDQPRSILEIGALLGYKDKKTTRKYLNPLLEEGLIARTVPDRPNSRNQKYITARNV